MSLPFDPARFRHGPCRLLPMRPEWAARFGEALAGLDPWLRLGYSPAGLARYLSADRQERRALAVLAGGAPAACLAVRPNWLRGPLLELLAVLPTFQGDGLGKALVLWLAEEARRQGQANLWTLAAEFNQSARAFYQRQGFEEAGVLPALISPGETEILLRLRIGWPPAKPG
jgi:GNAT superfamily N-acetyltransferase